MTENDIKQQITAALNTDHVHVEGDGYHFMAIVVSADFENQRSVQRQQAVYACVKEQLASGALHALSLKTYTPAEWKEKKDQ